MSDHRYLVEKLAEAIHNATLADEDGGVPDVCNRYGEHYALAEKLVKAGWVHLGRPEIALRNSVIADGTIGMRRGE